MRAKNRKKKIRLRNILTYLIFATNIIVILLLFSSYLSWEVSPLKTNLFSYIGLVFGVLLTINCCYLLFWIIFKKWGLALFTLVSLLICYKPILTFFPLHINQNRIPEESIQILSYNISGLSNESKKSLDEHPILEYIARTDADIVCLQEYMVSKTGKSLISQRDVNRILNKYPYQSIIGLEASGKYHTYGLACFSKYPIEKSQEIIFESSYNGAAVYKININGKKYTIANVHLESNSITAADKQLYNDFLQRKEAADLDIVTSNIRTRLGQAYRKRVGQVEKVKNYISKQSSDGVIICGDFNDTPISYAYSKMKVGLKDAYVSTGFGPGITYHEDLFLFRIDHIFHSPNIKAYQTKVDKVKFSDHYPLRTYLYLDN